MLAKIFTALLGGFLVSLLGSLVVLISAGNDVDSNKIAQTAFVMLFISSIIVTVLTDTAARAWRWYLMISASLCFLLPISTMIYSGLYLSETSGAAAQAGAFFGGALATIVTSIFSFFLGIIFLVIGFQVGNKTKADSD